MNNRFLLALVLTAIVIVVTPMLFPNALKRPPAVLSDSLTRRVDTALLAPSPMVVPQPPPAIANSIVPAVTSGAIVPETTTVHAAGATYTLSNIGAAPTSLMLDNYPSHRKDVAPGRVQLLSRKYPLTSYKLALGKDTIRLDTIAFRTQKDPVGAQTVTFLGNVSGRTIELAYAFPTDTTGAYLIHLSAKVSDAPPGSRLIVGLPQTLFANETDTTDDLNHLAVSYRSSRGDVSSVAFAKLDTAEVRREAGPITWAAARNKYFVVIYRSTKTPFSILELRGTPRTGKIAETMVGDVALPLGPDGSAAFDIYAGPQSFSRLEQLGDDLDQVNPYAGLLHGVVQPFTKIVMKALLWMKHTTQLNYGWVLVLFGVLVRLVLWPLNQSAMRTSMKMQRLQPELQALQKKYSDDPKKQQEAVMKVYKDHGMSPLSPLMGCLPMLLPMPVLFALYQVFQNTIEFRGVPFLWLSDLSQRDPLFITPLLMGVSMFAMSWIGMRNSPPNPQAKMMSYMMPVMLTVLFLNFASGLNLYYAVQNVAAIPQQWLLARERGKQAIDSTAVVRRRG
ncbi:membrane protein insertase YidC [soil metagenome]